MLYNASCSVRFWLYNKRIFCWRCFAAASSLFNVLSTGMTILRVDCSPSVWHTVVGLLVQVIVYL